MSRNVKVGFIILFILIIGLILSVFLSRQLTQTKQNASGTVNLNTSSQISQTKNKDSSMGPASSNGNYSNKLNSSDLGTVTFSITDPSVGKPTFPPKIPTITPESNGTGENRISETPASNGPQKVKSLIIKVRKIEVHLKNAKNNGNVNVWETLNLQTAMSFDLAQLVNGAVVNFSLTKLAVGDYDEVRIYIESANAVLENDLNITLSLNDKIGIVRVLQNFTIEKGRNTNLLIDFDAQQSVIYSDGKYTLNPFVVKLDVNK